MRSRPMDRMASTGLASGNGPPCRLSGSSPLFSSLRTAGGRNERCLLARLQRPHGIQKPVKLDGFCHQAGPAGLMARAQPGTAVAVEVLVEENVVAPVGIGLEFLRAAVDGASALLVP